jgi:hypothetical protein
MEMMYDEETDSLRPSIVSDPPKIIWLNVGEPEHDCSFKELGADMGEVTWCENEQFPSDIKYILHSDHEAALKAEREKEREACAAIVLRYETGPTIQRMTARDIAQAICSRGAA